MDSANSRLNNLESAYLLNAAILNISYDKVYSSGQNDPDTSFDERVPSSNSPSSEGDGNVDVDESKDDLSDQGMASTEPLTQSVIGPDGLKEFILLPLWMCILAIYLSILDPISANQHM
nr:hypothetical protein CFP56_44231 [Quercus suber]